MSQEPEPRVVSDADVAGLVLRRAGEVDLRRDLHQFLRYVASRGLTRTRRGNLISKTDARRLAKVLSYADEAEAVEANGCGIWSDFVSEVARSLGLVSFDVKGVYVGYSSSEPSFPDNEVQLDREAWEAYLDRTPLQKEATLLDVLLDRAPSEFFRDATLIPGSVFDSFGSATGPASRMKLPEIRRALLALLGTLRPGVWYEMRGLVELLRASQPHLILDPATREEDAKSKERLWVWQAEGRKLEWGEKWQNRPTKERALPPRPKVTLEDLYTNFREGVPGEWGRGKQITEQTPDAFHSVEGRYFEWFLREAPFLAGLVDLAYRRESDLHGQEVVPPFERLRAVRLNPKLFQLLGRDPALDRVSVTVLPTFEVLIEAPSHPEKLLDTLAPYCVLVQEDRPIYRLRLDRKTVVDTAASRPDARPAAKLLAELSGRPLPENVCAELEAWGGHAEKLTLYEEAGLLELRGDAQQREKVLAALPELVLDDRLEGFLLVRQPARVYELLEHALQVPVRVQHPQGRISSKLGSAATGTKRKAARPAPSPKKTVRLEAEDLVGYRSGDGPLLRALHDALKDKARTCALMNGSLLIISAAALPHLRSALLQLADRYDVQL